MDRNRFRLPALAAAVAVPLVLAGCGAQSGPNRALAAQPAAAHVPAAAAPAVPPAANCADGLAPTASFAPNGSVADLAQLPGVQRIRQTGRLVVGTSGDVPLWGVRDAKHGSPTQGQLTGFDIELLQNISKAIFNGQVRLAYHVINYGQRIPSLQKPVSAGGVDIVAHTMTINCERWKQIDFSSEYYAAGQEILVREDSNARSITELPKGTRVCVALNSTNIDNIKKYPQLVPTPVDDLGDCLVRFQEGTSDAITGDNTVLFGFKQQDPYAKVLDQKFTDEPYGLGFPKGDSDVVRYVNALLDQWRADGTLKAIYDHTMGSVPDAPAAGFPVPTYGRARQ